MDNKFELLINKPLAPRFQLVFSRVQKMILKAYGVSTKYRSFPFKNRQNESILKGLLVNNNPLHLMDKVIVPIYNGPQMIGVVELSEAQHLAKSQINIIKNLVELLSINQDLPEKLSSLIKVEETLALAELQDQSNVLPFKKSTEFFAPTANKKRSLFSSKRLTDFSTLVLSNSYSNIEAMAQEIHYRSERYAFLPLEDLDILHSNPNELLELGSISILAIEFMDLKPEEFQLVERILRLPQDQEGPRLIMGSTHSLDSIRRKNLMENHYLKKLAIFRMSKDFDEYDKEELIAFFANKIRSKIFN